MSTVMTLLAGRYRLSVAVVDGSDNETYDYHDRLYDFQIYPDSRNERYGFVTLGGDWQIETPINIQDEERAIKDGSPAKRAGEG